MPCLLYMQARLFDFTLFEDRGSTICTEAARSDQAKPRNKKIRGTYRASKETPPHILSRPTPNCINYGLSITCRHLEYVYTFSLDSHVRDRHPMMNIARRGPTSIAKSLFTLSNISRCSRQAHTRQSQGCVLRLISPTTSRPFGSSSQWNQSRQTATASASAEDEAIGSEIEQEVSSQRQPSNAQIENAAQHGPVTKFKDLAERGLVCRTLVDTLTKEMGFETMTNVQSLTLNQSLKGQDM